MIKNNFCFGDLFEIDGVKYYRCMWDSTIFTFKRKLQNDCVRCRRPISATKHDNIKHGTFKYAEIGGMRYILPPDEKNDYRLVICPRI